MREQLLARCREERIEPPSGGRVDRIVRSALHRGEELLFAQVAARVPEPVRARLLTLVTADEDADDGEDGEDGEGPTVLASIRSDPGNVSLNTMLTEIAKLEPVRAVGLPDGLFADIAPRVVTAWRGRAAIESPSHLHDHAPEVMLMLLAALLYCREREITDTLVELLISMVHRINARAEVKVTKELIRSSSGSPERRTSCSGSPRRPSTPGTAGARHGVPGRAAAGAPQQQHHPPPGARFPGSGADAP